ncbi:MAG: CDC27 family protein [Saprospiraceae bacterium]|nr:CDC27 family protein [Saprospiraceae bacterium]
MKLFKKYQSDQELDPKELEQISSQLITAGLDYQKKEAWAKKLAEEHEFERPKPVRTIRLIPTLLKIAAGLLLLLGLYFLWPNNTANNTLQAQLALHLEADALPHNKVRKGPSDLEELQQSFVDAYSAEDYTKAVALGNQLIQQETVNNTENLFYLALSHFYLKDYEMASSILSPLQASITEGRPFDQESSWFLALCHLQLGKIDQAKPLLVELQAVAAWKSDAASQLLDLLPK